MTTYVKTTKKFKITITKIGNEVVEVSIEPL